MKTSLLTASAALLLGCAAPGRAAIMFAEDSNDGTMKKITSAGAVIPFISSGMLVPSGEAFDANGNLFVADQAKNLIYKITPAGGLSVFAGVQFTTTHGLDSPMGIAFDNAGNLYVANSAVGSGGSPYIEKFTPGGVGTLFSATGLNQPYGLAFDVAGNLYAANQNGSTIEKYTPGGAASVFVTIGVVNPSGLAFDKQGNLYVAYNAFDVIEKFTPGGVGSVFASTGLDRPLGLAFDDTGNLYASNHLDSTIYKFTSGGVATLFNNTLRAPAFFAFTDDSGRPLTLANGYPSPEPASAALLGLGALLLATRRRP